MNRMSQVSIWERVKGVFGFQSKEKPPDIIDTLRRDLEPDEEDIRKRVTFLEIQARTLSKKKNS